MAPAIGRFLANIRNSPIGGRSPGIMRASSAPAWSAYGGSSRAIRDIGAPLAVLLFSNHYVASRSEAQGEEGNMRGGTPRPGVPVRESASGRPVMAALDLLGRRWTLRVLREPSQGPDSSRELQ